MNEPTPTPAQQAVTRTSKLGFHGVRDILKEPGIAARIKEVLGEKGPQFASSVLTVCGDSKFDMIEPRSIVGAAMIAATLDLPIEKSLGFAHIVPYAGKAQFQVGYKGLIQLALRSGQYAGMNAIPVNAAAFGGYDEVGDPIIDWSKIDRQADAVGYVFAWKLVSGFRKVIYWSRVDVEAHARRFSQAYRSGRDTPWKTDFGRMALKTVIKDGLGHWGILSVQMQQAMVFDQATVADVGAAPEYIDGSAPTAIDAGSMMQAAAPDPAPPPTAPPIGPVQGSGIGLSGNENIAASMCNTPFKRKPGRPMFSKNKPKTTAEVVSAGLKLEDEAAEAGMGLAPAGDAPPPPTVPLVVTAPTEAPQGIPAADPYSAVATLQALVSEAGHSFSKMTRFLSDSGFIEEADTWAFWMDIPVKSAEKILASKIGLMRTLATLPEPK